MQLNHRSVPSLIQVSAISAAARYLLVPGADLAVEVECLLGLLELAAMQQVGADHHAGATFSRLAVDGGDVQLILAQPLIQVLTERPDQLQLGGVVVLERVLSHWQGDR